MENSWYSFEVSTGWVLLALVVAVALAFFLYSKKGVPWSRNGNLMLGALRMMSLFLIGLLLLNPLLKLSVNDTERPKVLLAVDNSESVSLRGLGNEAREMPGRTDEMKSALSDQYDVSLIDLGGTETDSLTFEAPITNLSAMLQTISQNYEGENVGAVVLVSDGIVNSGLLPQYNRYTFPVYSLALGDTTAPRDLQIHNIRSNKIAYQGNQFPVSVQLKQKGFDGQVTTLEIREGSKVLAKKAVKLQGPLSTVDFNLDADEAGQKRLSVSLTRLEGESSTINNQQDLYVNIIEGKERVLIMAPAPHPDISAIRKVLEEAANYETLLFIPGISEPDLTGEFDVVIEHQAFTYSRFPKVKAGGKWYIMGNRSTYGLKRSINYLKIGQRANQTDQVKPLHKADFSLFALSPDALEHLSQFPPLTVPFGDYALTGPVQVLLSQGVGSVDSGRPLMLYYDDGTTKEAITAGSGIWQWRLQEYGSHGEAPLFKELVLKTIQYLSIKADKKKFNVKPRQQAYNESDRVYIDTEVYNDVYDRVYGNTIDLNLTNENGETSPYQLIDSELNSYFNLGRMDAGVYRYTARTTLGGKSMTDKGEFVVKAIQLEALNLQADHDLLRAVSRTSQGRFYKWADRDQLQQDLISAAFPGVIHTDESLIPLINSIWLMVLIMLLLSTEWFLRKYWGAY